MKIGRGGWGEAGFASGLLFFGFDGPREVAFSTFRGSLAAGVSFKVNSVKMGIFMSAVSCVGYLS